MEARELEGTPSVPDVARVQLLAPVALLWIACVATYGLLRNVTGRGQSLETLMQFAYLVPFLLASVATVRAFTVSVDRERRFWRALGTGIVLLTLAETFVSVQLMRGETLTIAWPAVPVVLGFAASGFVIVGLFRLTDFRTLTAFVRMRHIIDAIGTMLFLVGFLLAVVLVPMSVAYGPASPGEMLVAAGYSMSGVLLLIATTINFASRSWSRWRVCERQVVIGIGAYGFATAIWPAWYLGAALRPSLPWDSLVEVLWMTGMLLVFAGALTRLRSNAGDVLRFRAVPRMRPRRHGALSITLPVTFGLAVPAFGYMALTQAADPLIVSSYGIVALGLAAVVAARTAISAIENESLFDRAVNDPLTELFGHRYFHERLQVEVDLAQRHGDPLSIVVLDIDEFSHVNSVFGHSHGDDVLRSVASVLRQVCRGGDAACRLGADEFAIVLPATSVSDAEAISARIRSALRTIEVGECGPLSASIGIASFPDDASDREDLFHKADGALYWAKYHGKDKVVVFDDSVVESLSAQERIAKLEEQSHLATVRALAAAVDARDPLTQFHSRNVAVLAVMLAEEMQLDLDKRGLIEIAALLHDIGKIGISDRVLRKRGPLTAAEMRHIREHPGLGEKILMSTQLVEVLPWVRHHHERWDGTGYPDGLAGDTIPLEARLLCICDAYDAMTSARPYRTSLSSSAALQELDLCIGTQFDPTLTEAFIRLVGRRRLLRPETRFASDDSAAADAS